VSGYNCNVVSACIIYITIPVSGVTQTITATVATVGTYNYSITVNGVTFAASGTFPATGNRNILLAATGTPTAAGTYNHVLNTSVNCNFDRIAYPALVGGAAECSGTTPTTVVEVTSSSGMIWMDRNLGASRAATAFNDYLAYGCNYQWGRGNDGHASVTWTTSTAGVPVNSDFVTGGTDWDVVNADRWQGTFGENNPCPNGFRIPTQAEFDAEKTAYTITNSATAYSAIQKFVTAGKRSNSSGLLSLMGTTGNYWTSDISSNNSVELTFNATTISFSNQNRSVGFAVRCIKD
jgi:uncharacterized protein (TIGR02145 family)